MKRLFQTAALTAIMMVSLVGPARPLTATDLPEELVALLPAGPDLLVVIPSVKELDRAWNEMRVLATEFSSQVQETPASLDDLLMKALPLYYESIDQTRPLALAVSLPNPMVGQQMIMSGVIPVKDGYLNLQALADTLKVPTIFRKNNYLLVSQVPSFVEADRPARLLDNLPQGSIAVCVDLQNLWTSYGPMLDFALMAMNTPAPPAPDGTPASPKPAMTSEQVTAMGDLTRQFMQSADILSLGLDLRDGSLSLAEKFTVLPGSAMAPVPQPDFHEALELSRYLPNDADWVMAYALDLGEIFELYKEFYRASLEMEYAKMSDPSDLDLDALLDSCFLAMDQMQSPTAMSLDLERRKISVQYVTRIPDAQAVVELQTKVIETLNKQATFVTAHPVEGLKIDGLPVHAWDYQWDSEVLLEMTRAAADSTGDGDAEEAARMAGLLKDFLPGVRMVTKEDLLFVTLGRDLEPLTRMVKESKQSRGAVNPALAKLVKKAGPACQGVFQGDLAGMLNLFFEIAEEGSGQDFPALKLEPMPMTYVMSLDANSYAVEYECKVDGIGKFIAAMEKFEGQESR